MSSISSKDQKALLRPRPEAVLTQHRQTHYCADERVQKRVEAKELATNLPGNLRIDEQQDVIEMLMELRDRKRRQLMEFASRSTAAPMSSAVHNRMDVDSVVSTPFVEET
ncbi:hypothetical protein C8F01DRAFT_108503 [Mycena amicta]|nr:hypothetical protein C8F01DRAFT_108503 [Mycena amicta]